MGAVAVRERADQGLAESGLFRVQRRSKTFALLQQLHSPRAESRLGLRIATQVKIWASNGIAGKK